MTYDDWKTNVDEFAPRRPRPRALHCEYCDEAYTEIAEDEWVPECECEAREAKRQAAEDAYWDRRINEARGK